MAMLRSATPPHRSVVLLVLGMLIVAGLWTFTPLDATITYKSHDKNVRYFTSARPAALGDRCYQETTGTALCSSGQTCVETGRTPWWDNKRGPYHLIQFKALHTSLCTSQCCPADPPVGTCYKKWLTASCAMGYTKAYSSILSGSLCCVTGSCFWFMTSMTNCECPKGYESQDRTDSCMANGWALCCPVGADVSAMELSNKPFDAPPPGMLAVAAPPPPTLAVAKTAAAEPTAAKLAVAKPAVAKPAAANTA